MCSTVAQLRALPRSHTCRLSAAVAANEGAVQDDWLEQLVVNNTDDVHYVAIHTTHTLPDFIHAHGTAATSNSSLRQLPFAAVVVDECTTNFTDVRVRGVLLLCAASAASRNHRR
jgi:hypothetical protein